MGETNSYGTTTPNTYVLKCDSLGVSTGNVVIGIPEQIRQVLPDMIVYPNPARSQEQINILLPQGFKGLNNHSTKLSLYDTIGRILDCREIDISSHHIILKNIALEAGMFFIRVESANKSFTQKIIITD